MRIWKALLSILTLGLLCALLISGRNSWKVRSKLLRSGRLGTFSVEEVQAFETFVRETLQLAGIKDPVIVNEAPTPNHFHIYLTTSEFAQFTGCAKGNAIYDTELDAIFFDRNLFFPNELGSLADDGPFAMVKSSLPFYRTFLRLILLHELGHRKLHRKKGSFLTLFSSSSGKNREMEADKFAISILREAYEQGTLKDLAVKDELIEAGISPDMNAGEQFLAALFYASFQLSNGLLFANGSFSSIHADSTHPSFGERMQNLEKVIVSTAVTNNITKLYFKYFRAISDRVEKLRRDGLVEIQIDTPIGSVAFEDDRILIIDRNLRISSVPWTELGKAKRNGEILIPHPLCELSTFASDRNLDSWSMIGTGTFFRKRGQIVQLSGKTLTPKPDIARDLGVDLTFIRMPGAEPANIALRDEGRELILLGREGVLRRFSWTNLIRLVEGAANVPMLKHLEPMVLNDTVFVPFRQKDGPVCVVLRLGQDSSTVDFTLLTLDDTVDRTGKVLVARNSGQIRYFLFGKLDLLSEVSVWELFERTPPVLRASYTPPINALASEPFSGQNVSTVIASVTLANQNIMFVKLMGDSLLRYDVGRNVLSSVFPSAFANITFSKNNCIAFSVWNGYKVFVGQTSILSDK